MENVPDRSGPMPMVPPPQGPGPMPPVATGKPIVADGYYGSRLREYKNLTYVGMALMLLAPVFLGVFPFIGDLALVGIVSSLFIGGMCAISGYVGLRDEKKKFGIQRKYSNWGRGAFILGIMSVLIGTVPVIPILLGAIAIGLGIKARGSGDLELSEIGIWCGAMGVIINIFFILLFWVFFPT